MARSLFHRAGQPQKLGFRCVASREHAAHRWLADRQRAGLVEDGGIHVTQRLERATMPDDNLSPSRGADSADDAIGVARMRGQGVATTSTASTRVANYPDSPD